MEIVFMPGVWDLLHVGHLRALERASSYGYLVVGVASDEVVEEDKGSPPIISEGDRVEMVRSLKVVHQAICYRKLEFLTVLDFLVPDVLAVGTTWGTEQRHRDAEDWVVAHRKRFVKIPYTSRISSSLIKERIRSEESSICS